MKKYPTDLSDNQWQFIKKALQLGERKRKHNLRTIVECYQLPDKNRLPVADASDKFCQMAISLLLLQEMV